MRAREFIREEKIDEVLPIIGAIGGALARGTLSAGSALAKGAVNAGTSALKSAGTQAASTLGGAVTQGVTQLGKQAASSLVKNLPGATGQQTQDKTKPTAPPPTPKIPSGTDLKVLPSANPNKLSFDLGGAKFDLDLKDPKNSQILQQLGQMQPK